MGPLVGSGQEGREIHAPAVASGWEAK
jgi:hypothetical protein